jgi:hypothetical protein
MNPDQQDLCAHQKCLSCRSHLLIKIITQEIIQLPDINEQQSHEEKEKEQDEDHKFPVGIKLFRPLCRAVGPVGYMQVP